MSLVKGWFYGPKLACFGGPFLGPYLAFLGKGQNSGFSGFSGGKIALFPGSDFGLFRGNPISGIPGEKSKTWTGIALRLPPPAEKNSRIIHLLS